MAVILSNRSNRFMAKTAIYQYLMLVSDDSLALLMSDREENQQRY